MTVINLVIYVNKLKALNLREIDSLHPSLKKKNRATGGGQYMDDTMFIVYQQASQILTTANCIVSVTDYN